MSRKGRLANISTPETNKISNSRSIGIQVTLCHCECHNFEPIESDGISKNSPCSFTPTEAIKSTECGNNKEDKVLKKRLSARISLPSQSEMEGNNKAEKGSPAETSHLLCSSETSSCSSPPADGSKPKRSSSTSESILRREVSSHSSSYHFKKKYNFRSDSVFSDVMPMSSSATTQIQEEASGNKATGDSVPREKSGSLSSLKPRESKWVYLRRKLTKEKVNPKKAPPEVKQSSSSNSQGGKKEQEGLLEKRSLLQRAKTLSILPVNRSKDARKESKEEKEEAKKMKEPPELFNVGGEMNMIPLEMLIDINDLKQ